MKSKITYRENEFIIEVPKEIEIISEYNNSIDNDNNELFYKAYYFLIDFYTEKLKECLPELKEGEDVIFEGFYQGRKRFVNIVNFEKI